MNERPTQPTAEAPSGSLPTAELVANKRLSWAWAPPVIALVLVALAAWSSWHERGLPITVDFQHGHGIKQGDTLRYRGITAGEVEAVRLSDDLLGATIEIRLDSRAQGLARAGSRFWVVRPQIGLSGIVGLDTVVGARYLAVHPGDPDAPREKRFVGLEDPPVLDTVEPGSLEIVLEARARGSLRAGAPVTYRGIDVGRIVAVRLESDATSVECRASIEAPYAGLVRENTRFWDTGGLLVDIGLSGVRLEIDSLESFVAGGVALATPNDAGSIAQPGARFALHARPQEEWLDWRPPLPLGDADLPDGGELPQPVSVLATWREGRLVTSSEARAGWALPVAGGLLGPANLLLAPENARDGTFEMKVSGAPMVLPRTTEMRPNGLALVRIDSGLDAWPEAKMRRMLEAEDCLVVTDTDAEPLALAAVRMASSEDGWAVTSGVRFAASAHGAAVVARSDSKLVGFLLVEGSEARIASPL